MFLDEAPRPEFRSGRRADDTGLTCTVLSRTTWDTVSRSCAAMPGFPRPRVNFLSLIANAERRRSNPGSVPPSDAAAASAASGRIGHRARPRRGRTIGDISRNRPAASSQSIRIARPTPVGHHQSRPVPVPVPPLRSDRQSRPPFSFYFPLVSEPELARIFVTRRFYLAPDRCDAWNSAELERVDVKSRYEAARSRETIGRAKQNRIFPRVSHAAARVNGGSRFSNGAATRLNVALNE